MIQHLIVIGVICFFSTGRLSAQAMPAACVDSAYVVHNSSPHYVQLHVVINDSLLLTVFERFWERISSIRVRDVAEEEPQEMRGKVLFRPLDSRRYGLSFYTHYFIERGWSADLIEAEGESIRRNALIEVRSAAGQQWTIVACP